MAVISINSPGDPRLEPYRNLKQTNRTRWSGEFVAEGRLVVERLLASRLGTTSLLLSEQRRGLLDELPLSDGVEVFVVSEETARELTGFGFHAGVLACGRRGPAVSLDAWIADRLANTNGVNASTMLVACPQMTDPDNLGGLIRLCRAFGVAGLCLGEACCDPFSRRTLRVSMGNAFDLPILESTNLAHDMQRLRTEYGFSLTATVLGNGAVPLHTARPIPRDILLLGNEAHGLPAEWIAISDRLVTIPMHGGTDSLNVTVAAGICLHWWQQAATSRSIS